GESSSVGGERSESFGSYDYWIIKLNATGEMEWEKSFGGSGLDSASSICETAEGGYIIAGRSNSTNGHITDNQGNYDYWVVKLDDSGNMQWQKSLGGNGIDVATS